MTTSQHTTICHQPHCPATRQASTGSEFDTSCVTGLGLAHTVNDTYAGFLPPLLPVLMEKLSMSKTQAGLIAFLSSSPSLLQPMIGYLADHRRLGRFGRPDAVDPAAGSSPSQGRRLVHARGVPITGASARSIPSRLGQS